MKINNRITIPIILLFALSFVKNSKLNDLFRDTDNLIIKFKENGEIVMIHSSFNNTTIKTTKLNSPIISTQLNIPNMNFNNGFILPNKDGNFFAINNVKNEYSIEKINLDNLFFDSSIIIHQHQNYNLNKKEKKLLFSLDIETGVLRYLEKDCEDLIMCKKHMNKIYFWQKEYYIEIRNNNNDIINKSNFIQIIPYDINFNYQKILFDNFPENNQIIEENDYYIYEINKNLKEINIRLILSKNKNILDTINLNDIPNNVTHNNCKNKKNSVLKNNSYNIHLYRIINFFLLILLIIINSISIYYLIVIKKQINKKSKLSYIKDNNYIENNINDINKNIPKIPTYDGNISQLSTFDSLNLENKNKACTSFSNSNLIYYKTNGKKLLIKNKLKHLKAVSFLNSKKSTKRNLFFNLKFTPSSTELSDLNILFTAYINDINKKSSGSLLNFDSNINDNIYNEIYKIIDSGNSENSSTTNIKNNNQNMCYDEETIPTDLEHNFLYFFDNGRVLKYFKDFKFLGKGGFGCVFQATHKIDGNQYAIKVVKINLESNNSNSELQDIQEIKTMLKFENKNIVRYITCWFEFNDKLNTNKRARTLSEEKYMSNFAENKISGNLKMSLEKIRNFSKKIKFAENKRNINNKKAIKKTSLIWDSDNESSSDYLGANKNYTIKEEENCDKYIKLSDEENENDSSESFNNENSENDSKNSINDKNNSSKNNSQNDNNSDNEFKLSEMSNQNNINNNSDEINNKNNKRNRKCIKYPVYFFIQMEHCSGCPLNYYLLHRKYVPSNKITTYIFYQICKAVEHIHEANIIHRDLKPANIFLINNYKIKIGDFGLALNSKLKQFKQGGTYLYESPEQINKEPYDEKIDIFAIGVIFVELLSKFNTEFERRDVLAGLKKGQLPDYLQKDHLREYNLIKKMTSEDSKKRPDIKSLLNDKDFISLINENLDIK